MASQPRSPKHYDKYTYSSRRRPEAEGEGSPCRSPFRNRPQRRGDNPAYDACVAGVAPLLRNADGFAIGEDGTVQSRFVSAPRFSMPQIALVPIPMTVIPSPHHVAAGSAATVLPRAVITRRGGTEGIEYEAWNRLALAAQADFSPDELGALNWDTIVDLMRHYNFTNPIDTARIQLAWKRKQGLLPSDSDILGPLHAMSAPLAPVPGQPRSAADSAAFYMPASIPRHAVSPVRNRVYDNRPESPRRSPVRYVPSRKSPMRFSHVSPKVDTGLGDLRRKVAPRHPASPGDYSPRAYGASPRRATSPITPSRRL